MKEKLSISICMPVYNGGKVIGPTIESILSQSYRNYEFIIVNDASLDNSELIIKSYKDKRIKYFMNKINLGYSKNIEECRKKAKGDIVFLMGQDDILGENALKNTIMAFLTSNKIGAVTRPYFWFDEDINLPVRAKMQLNPNKDETVTINDSFEKIATMLDTLDQLSGLAYRRKYMDIPFHEDVFPCHIYPFISIFKKYPVIFLKDYNIAVRISTSQTRSLSSIYKKSPMKSWKEMFENLMTERELKDLKEKCISEFVATNYVGLVQLKNYARFRYFLREVFYLITFRPKNLVTYSFWFYTIICLFTPRLILIPFVDWYKNKINSQTLKKMGINFNFKYNFLPKR